MIQCNITGRLIADAEVKTIGDNDFYKLCLVDNKGKDKPGKFATVLSRKFGTTDLTQYFRKGAIISAAGEPEASAFAGQDGRPRAALTIWADRVKIEQFAPDEQGGLLD